MEQNKEQVVASFDFGANGKMELTPTKLIGKVSGDAVVATPTGRKNGTQELRVKLEVLKNFDLIQPKSFGYKMLHILEISTGLVMVLFFLGLLLGVMFSGFTNVAGWGVPGLMGMILGVIVSFFLGARLWKNWAHAFLVFSSPDYNVSIPCDRSRISELETFVQTVKDARDA